MDDEMLLYVLYIFKYFCTLCIYFLINNFMQPKRFFSLMSGAVRLYRLNKSLKCTEGRYSWLIGIGMQINTFFSRLMRLVSVFSNKLRMTFRYSNLKVQKNNHNWLLKWLQVFFHFYFHLLSLLWREGSFHCTVGHHWSEMEQSKGKLV